MGTPLWATVRMMASATVQGIRIPEVRGMAGGTETAGEMAERVDDKTNNIFLKNFEQGTSNDE